MFMQTLKSHDERLHIPSSPLFLSIKVVAVTMEICIYEDDNSDAQNLKTIIESYAEFKQISATITIYKHGRNLLHAIKAHEVDLLFLDIDAGENEPDGFEIAKQIHAWNADLPIVFTTYLREYALLGYEVEALHYLIKPVTLGNIEACFERLERAKAHHPKKKPSISIVSEYKQLTIPVENIRFAEVKGNTVTIHLSDRSIPTNMSMSSLEQQVKGMLIRCHRSYLVNPKRIVRIDHNDFMLSSGEKVPIRINGRRKIIAQYHDWLAKQTNDSADDESNTPPPLNHFVHPASTTFLSRQAHPNGELMPTMLHRAFTAQPLGGQTHRFEPDAHTLMLG